MTSGKVKTLFSDKEKTEALFPRTKTSAVSNEDGIGLDALMENLIYSSNENLNQDTVPLNADTLGGYPAEDYASKLYVKEQILKVQEGTGVDLSEFATKEDLAAIDFPVDSVNGYTGTIQLNADDVGALGNKGNQLLSDGSLQINDTSDQGYCFSVIRTRDGIKYNSTVDMIPTSGAGLYYYKDGVLKNSITLGENNSSLYKALTIESGGTGATTAADARNNLGAATRINAGTYTGDLNVLGEGGVPNNSIVWVTPDTINVPHSNWGFVETWQSQDGAELQRYTGIDKVTYVRSRFGNGISVDWHGGWQRVDSLDCAPNGYGLGNFAYTLTEITNANNAYQNGWYLLSKDAANGFGYRGAMHVNAYSSSYLMQTLYVQGYSTKMPIIVQRTCVEGTWSEWEFVNPPMIVDTLYRTTELYQGKVVYAKLVNFGTLPNSTQKLVGFYGSGATAVISLTAMLSDGCCISAGYNRDMSHATSSGLYLDNTLYNIRIKTEYDMSSLSAYVLVKFTID